MTAAPSPLVLAVLGPAATTAPSSCGLTVTVASGMTRPDWSVTVTTIRPRRAGSWAAAGAHTNAIDAASVAKRRATAADRGTAIYFETWNVFASIFGFTLNDSTIISSEGLPSIERWMRCGSCTPPTLR